MANPIRRLLRRCKYGEEIVIVSGLPRSGTSMMMRMLEAGGLEIMTDYQRVPDTDNPIGYYEYERVKDLEKDSDKTWLQEGRGKVLKVISHLLKELPDDHFYRVLMMRRDLDEVISSQNKMLERQDKENPIEDEKAKDLFRKHLVNVRMLAHTRPNLEILEVKYTRALEDPASFVAEVNGFLSHKLDEQRMMSVVDRRLYRNRKELLQAESR